MTQHLMLWKHILLGSVCVCCLRCEVPWKILHTLSRVLSRRAVFLLILEFSKISYCCEIETHF